MEQIKLPRLSASKLKLYQKCPKMYLHKYRDRADSSNIWAIVGTAAHSAIEQYYLYGTSMAQTFMQKLNNVNADIEGYQYFPTLLNDILRGLNTFNADKYETLKINDKLQLEQHFRLKYPNDENPICTLEGYIDRLIPDGFIDYKTGKEKVSKKALKNDLQFAVYFWAYERIRGMRAEKGIYHRIRDNKETIITETNDILDTAIRTMLNDPMIYDDSPCDSCVFYCALHQKHET